jgi:hypothetical protein
MAAGTYNFEIEQGATFSRVITYKDSQGEIIPLFGAQARMDLKLQKSDQATILALRSDDDSPMIIINRGKGTLTLNIPRASTEDLNFNKAYYDLELEFPNGTVVRILEGRVTLSKQTTGDQ